MSTDALHGAAVSLEEIVAKDPTTALYLPLAERLLARGRVAEAVRLCEERQNRPGQGVGDRIVLGRCYLADGRLAEATAQFKGALALDRENVVALKSLAGILSHEGRHAEAADLYRAVCRVDPGDLESQSALHQITSGEYPEVRPAEVIVSQGDSAWQPVRVTREEDHLPELALGLRTLEPLDPAGPVSRPFAPAAGPSAPPDAASAPPSKAEPILRPDEIEVGASFPTAPRPPVAEPPRRPSEVRRAPSDPNESFGERLGGMDVEAFQESALERLEEALKPIQARPLGEVEGQAKPGQADKEVTAKEPAATEAAVLAPAAPRAEPAATAPVVTPVAPDPAAPDASTAPDAPPPIPPDPAGKGNRAAFETWLRRLGGQ